MQPCSATDITPSSLPDLTYRVRDPTVNLNFNDFVVQPLCAYTWTYSVDQSFNLGKDYKELDEEFFVFDPDTNLISLYALAGQE